MLLLLHLFLLHYSASFLLFPCLRLALSLQISCFLSISAIPVFSRALLPSFPLLLLLVLSLPICHSLSIPPSPPSLKETIPHSLPLQARPWSGIRNPSLLLDRELKHLVFGTSTLLTAGTENRCHFRCQLQADEQQLPEGTDLLHGSCWADTECCLLAGVKLQAELSH